MNARTLFPGKRYRILRKPQDAILPSAPRPFRRDCHGRLMAALLDIADPGTDIEEDSLTSWASATFIGARHALTMLLTGEDAASRAAALTQTLPEADFTIPGHLVADIAIDPIQQNGSGEFRLTLSILTIEAW